MASEKTKQKILEEFLTLLAERPFDEVSLVETAERADVKLSVLRECYGSKLELVAAFEAMIDKTVLDGRDKEMADEPSRERLFDVLMSRLEALAPYKAAVGNLATALRKDPALAVAFNAIALRSQRWMLVAANIEAHPMKARLITQGLVVAFGRVVRVWLEEEDSSQPRTMAALDRALDKGVKLVTRYEKAEKLAGPLKSFLCRKRKGKGAEATSEASDDLSAPAAAI